MKIVHVITRLIVGGAQENTLLSCEGQHRRGHDVTLITGPSTGPEGSLIERAQSAGYRVEVIDEMRRSILPIRDYRSYRALTARFRELRPDVVHTHSSKAGIAGRFAADQVRKQLPPQERPAIVHTIHGLAFTASTRATVNAFYRYCERKAAPITDRIVCVADAMRDQSLAANIGTHEQYVTVYSGMETEAFLNPPRTRAEVRRELGLSEEHLAVGTIARLFHLKGHDDLLEAAPALCARFANLRFVWIGDGILRESFEDSMERIGLRERFILTGLVPPARIPELTGALDILVHPSRREGLARALPQGQLAGCPAVTYDIDGNREGLIDGTTGYLVRPFDRNELSGKIGVLLNDAEIRRRMGEAGRIFAAERFGAETMVGALERVYESALQEARAGK